MLWLNHPSYPTPGVVRLPWLPVTSTSLIMFSLCRNPPLHECTHIDLTIPVKMIERMKSEKPQIRQGREAIVFTNCLGGKLSTHWIKPSERMSVQLVNFESMVLCLTHFLILGSGSWGSAASDPVSQVFVSVTSWRKRRVYSMSLPSRLLNTMACEKNRIELSPLSLLQKHLGYRLVALGN